MRTQVGIIGAGPAGLLLAHLLQQAGIEHVVLETRSRGYVEQRVRAGVLEHGTVQTLVQHGLGERLLRQGLKHEGMALRFGGETQRIDFPSLTGGRSITVYGQQEVVKDLIAARLASGAEIFFESEAMQIKDLETQTPKIIFLQNGETKTMTCDCIAGTDGFHGVARNAIPNGVLQVFERTYPFAWLGILAEAKPSSPELIYANHQRGFALHSMRSNTVTRNYLQVSPTEDIQNWPDEKIWQELQKRLETSDGFALSTGPIFEKSITGMRGFVVEPMQYKRLYLAGDAAHIVPPTGAKGMNLAIHDVKILARAIVAFYENNNPDLLASYSQDCLGRVWRAQHFSYFMTSMLHRHNLNDPYEHKLQLAQLQQVVNNRAQAQVLAENYVGMLGNEDTVMV